MEKRKLGNSDLDITILGYQAREGNGLLHYAWGPNDEQSTVGAIHAALDCGINWIDTATVYGYGAAEEAVAKALAAYSGEIPYLFTKCSIPWDYETYHCLTANSVRKEAEDSLRRLNVERIDLYQIHLPSPEWEIEEGWTEMAKLQQEGKVRYLGVATSMSKR